MNRHIPDKDISLTREKKAQKQKQKCRFSCAVRTDDSYRFAVLEQKTDFFQSRRPVGVLIAGVSHFNSMVAHDGNTPFNRCCAISGSGTSMSIRKTVVQAMQ